MRRCLFAMLIVLVPALAAAAPAAPPTKDTLLHLTQSVTVLVKPDDFVVGFSVQAEAADPAEAQSHVNTLAATVLAEARKVSGAKVDTGAYNVWHQDAAKGRLASWLARQAITVHGPDAAALLKLAGSVQAQGVTVQQLAWRVSHAAAVAVEEHAQDQGLAELKLRAAKVASILGLRFARFQEVTLGGPPVLPMQRSMMAMAAAAPAAAPPVAASEDQPVTVTVFAVAVLEP